MENTVLAENKVRKYRLVSRNILPSEQFVTEQVKNELGDVNIVKWEIESQTHFRELVTGIILPQCITSIALEYTEK